MSGNYIGPVLPPGFILPSHKDDDSDEVNDNEAEEETSAIPGTSKSNSFYGPAIPPGLGSNIIGPTLPPQFARRDDTKDSVSESDEDEVVGPLPSEAAIGVDVDPDGAEDIEKRAQKMKDKLLGKVSEDVAPQVREEWMTMLPSNMVKKIGLGPRTFSRREAPPQDDGSAWTDTPADREKKARGIRAEKTDAKKEPDEKALLEEKRNREMAEQLEKYNKSKRKESLIDMHKKKRKKNADKDASKVRKEFDRDKDLGISHMDPLKAKRTIDGAKLLNGRFSHGSSHFL